METSLAIYEALLQANVPAAAARNVAEKLERDMTNVLATRQDVQLLAARMESGFALVGERFNTLRGEMTSQFDAFQQQIDSRFDASRQQMESRFARADERFDAFQKQMDSRFSRVDERFDVFQKQMDSRFARVDERFDVFQQQMASRFTRVDERFVSLENRLLVKLGSLMAVLLTLAIAALQLLG